MHGLILISIVATVALGQDICKNIVAAPKRDSDGMRRKNPIPVKNWSGPICIMGSMNDNEFIRDFSNCSEANKLMPSNMASSILQHNCSDLMDTMGGVGIAIPNRCVASNCTNVTSPLGEETFLNMFGHALIEEEPNCCLPKMKCQNFECPDGWESNANQNGSASETQCCYDNNNALFSLANYLEQLDQTKDCAHFLNRNTQYTCETPLSEFKQYSTSGNLTFYFNNEPLPFQNGKIKDICQCHCNGIKEPSVCYTERCCTQVEEEEIAQIIETWIIVTIVLSSIAAIAGSITAIVLCRRPGGCQCRVRTGPSVKATTIVYTKVNLEDTLKF